MQKKFQGLFINNTGCQSFFNKLDKYIKIYSDKISKGHLTSFFKDQKYTDELSPKSYYVDKNLEKQIVDFLRLLCKNDNTFMQNYIKKQHNNSRSSNLVISVISFTKVLMNNLHYPVGFDTFSSCLMCLLEFIQGPNKTNQNLLIINDFVPDVAKIILSMRYRDGSKLQSPGISIGHSDQFSVKDSITFKRSRSFTNSISIGKSMSQKSNGEDIITLPSTNYMISLAKLRVLLILNHLCDGFEPHEYVFYLYRRELSPEDFRLNLAYQHAFFNNEFNGELKNEMFFSYYQNINIRDKSPFLIEIGFECYFLLKKIEENIKLDYDERYYDNIIKLLPKWDKPQTKVNHNVIPETFRFFRDITRLFFSICNKKSKKFSNDNIESSSENDSHIKSILNFYENRSAQIEVLMDGDLQEFYFPRLPF